MHFDRLYFPVRQIEAEKRVIWSTHVGFMFCSLSLTLARSELDNGCIQLAIIVAGVPAFFKYPASLTSTGFGKFLFAKYLIAFLNKKLFN